jgi:gliding motility-associated-like protein
VTPDFFIPDGFSPNGDAVNDTFRIPNIEFIYPDYSLEIYNRYGSLMFTANKNKAEWDGKNSDSNMNLDGIAPNGIYFYIINFNKGNKSPKQGRLYLNR